MSDLTRVSETREWIQAWRNERPATARRVFARVATEQAANLRSAGRIWSAARVQEYTRCVRMIEAAGFGLREEGES